jgi:hypothetical protein
VPLPTRTGVKTGGLKLRQVRGQQSSAVAFPRLWPDFPAGLVFFHECSIQDLLSPQDGRGAERFDIWPVRRANQHRGEADYQGVFSQPRGFRRLVRYSAEAERFRRVRWASVRRARWHSGRRQKACCA